MRPLISNANQHKYLFTVFLFSCFFVFASPALAEGEISVNLRIETPSQTILNQQISVPFSCEVTDNTGATSTYGGYKTICALQSAQEQGLLTYNVNNFGWGLFIEKINNIGNDANMFWSLYQNNSASMVGATDLGLSADDKIILSYVDWNYSNEILQVVLSSSTAYINSSATLQAQIWNNTEFANFNSPVSFFIDGTAYDAPSGTLEYIPNAEGQQKIYVEATGKTRSDSQTINVVPAPQTTTSTEPAAQINHVVVNYLNEEIFNDDVSATSTWFYDSSGALFSTSTISTLGVLAEASRQGNFPLTIQGGWGYYVSSIGGHAAQGFDGWIYNINQQDPGWVGMNDYQIQNNNLLTVFYSVWPWKIESNTSSVHLGENVTFKALNYTSSTWQTSASTTVSINNQLFVTDGNGQHVYTPSVTGTLSAFIYGSESWPQNSPTINVLVLELASTSTTATTTDDNTDGNNNDNGGGGGSSLPTHYSLNVEKAIEFLSSKQSENGSIGTSAIYTDWSAIAFGAYDGSQTTTAKLKSYLLSDINPAGGMNEVSNYARRSMALMALNINPYKDTPTNYIKKIIDAFDGSQFGDSNLYNDDIFVLFPLLHAGYSANDDIIAKTVQYILSKQSNGSWGSVDLTAAAIQALAPLKNINGVNEAINSAKTFLQNNQQSDGGFGNAPATAWAEQAIVALNENPADWIKNNKNPNDFLYGKQMIEDGGIIDAPSDTLDTRIWNTAYAISASLGKTWNNILHNFARPTDIKTTENTGASSAQSTEISTTTPTSTPTSTIQTPNSNILTPTSTEQQIITSSPDHTITSSLDHSITESPTIIPPQNYNTATIPKTNNKYQIADNNLAIATPTMYYQSLSPTPTSTQPINTAKTVFNISLTAASGLGLYLAWRLLQTVI